MDEPAAKKAGDRGDLPLAALDLDVGVLGVSEEGRNDIDRVSCVDGGSGIFGDAVMRSPGR